MELSRKNALLVGLGALVLLGGCQSKQVYGVGDIGPAPFLRNVAPVAYSRVDPAPAPQPAYTIDRVSVDTVPQPTYILDSTPESVRMAEPVYDTEFISEPAATPISYSAPETVSDSVVYIEEASPLSSSDFPAPAYILENEGPSFDANTYLGQTPVVAPQPVYATEALPVPLQPSGIEVEVIPPQGQQPAPFVNQPGLSRYGEAF